MKFYLSLAVIFWSLNCLALDISGTVKDRSGALVSGATVKLVDLKNPSKEYVSYTNSAGQYVINETFPANNMFLFCYPNPFDRQTVISFHLDQKQRIELAIYNIAGQKISVISSGEFDSGHHQIVWDGLSQQGAPVIPGVYVCSLKARRNRPFSVKMIVQGGENIAVPVWSSVEPPPTGTEQIYSVSISGKGFVTHHVPEINLTGVSIKDFVIDRDIWTPFSTTGDYLSVYNGTDYTPVFIKGINLGATVPGSEPGQLAISSEQYARWFRMMVNAGFNTVRIYTLHYPRFYEEFARYNRENPDKPLFLLQGVWLNEEYHNPNAEDDLYSLTEIFDKEIQEVIDCIHGNRKIAFRQGAGYGHFKTDISQWLIGFVIGREIHAEEVGWTNYINHKVSGHQGMHVSINNVSPTEAWACERLDRLIAYERSKYRTTRPVSWSSWATLDPLTHPSEGWSSEEDSESIDLNDMKLLDAPGGYFASYHVYPYYPDFINWDENIKMCMMMMVLTIIWLIFVTYGATIPIFRC